MPANLTPEYLKAEERYRQARTPEEKLAALREMLATIPKHKGTEKLQAEIKRRIAQFRQQPKKKGPTRSSLDYIEREGAGQVALVGLPNSGKSSIVACLTNARPEVAEYPFSTLRPLPGMMDYEDIQIQLIDLPPLSREYTEGWVYAHIRNADLVLLTVDLSSEEPELGLLETLELLEEAGIKLISRGKGGFHEGQLYKRALGCGTRLDQPGAREKLEMLRETEPRLAWVGVSTTTGQGLEDLRRALFEALEIIRVYTKEPGKKPDLEKPYILPRGSTVLDLAREIHQDLARSFRYARLWGSSRFDGQQVPRDHPVQDKDIVEIHA